MDQAAVVFIFSLLLIGLHSSPSVKSNNWEIYSFHINTTVTSRYAITVITSRVANSRDNSTEIDFHVKIPKTAFISKFRMTIGEQTYDGVVKEKEMAQQQYTQAVSRGQSTGLVSSVGRTLEDFKTSVTVAAHSKVTFELTYEELLSRRLGKYELLINAQPGQIVKDFKIDVNIYEKTGINFHEVKGSLGEKDMASAVTTTRADEQVWVHFYPTRDQQMQCDGCGETGLKGNLKIHYDVNRPQSQGDVTEHGGYFVHFFAPVDLPRIPKNVVFLIDQSGSMHGRKIEQTRDALLKILDDLAEDDYFGLILFDSKVSPWKHELLQANHNNLKRAKDFVRRIVDRGATDINAAVLKGVEMINKHPRESSASILILLTDGDPTSGETNQGKIQSNVREAIGKKFPLYCLGFGLDVNFEFLQKMAQENSGVGRRIYEDSDAALQLKGFYEEVATPLLTSVQMNYTGATNLTQTTFSHYYNGSEIVVAGQITDNNINDFTTEVIAISKHNKVMYRDTTPTKDEKLPADLSGKENFLQRLWACLTVKQLLEKELMLSGEEKEAVRKMVLDLSLKYSFVTPLTSMVVTKPEGEDTQVANKPKEGEKPPITSRRTMLKLHVQSSPSMRLAQHGPGYVLPQSRQGKAMRGSSGGGAGGGGGRGRSFQGPPGFSMESHSHFLSMPALHGVASRSRPAYPGTDFDLFDDVPESAHLPLATAVSATLTPGTPVRFLMTAEGQSLPLCFDIPAGHSVRLLQDPTSGLSMNGELTSEGGNGFQRIIIHVNASMTIEFDTVKITVKDGQDTVSFMWTDKDADHTTDSLSLIIRDNEADITMTTIRAVILLHWQDGKSFLWPAVRKRPSENAIPGIMGKLPVAYEEIQPAKLRIQGQEVDATSDSAKDYSIKAAPQVRCQLVELKFALQGELSEFTVLQL
ncbi:inter-alpha-trypsin inhibitor heavy chain H3-like [Clupea harengus]|uniref:Inter-alpha-trypsin inhibitor heavy chain H3-like n=1 Tax=Clupea harengus TaxID=7950 RepID=A0A6P8FL98_CLUHA|nr:inter-alpha-trypsin inhibitor heavy chain H3-like [Clupea harengus]